MAHLRSAADFEDAAPDAPAGDGREEALDDIEPRR